MALERDRMNKDSINKRNSRDWIKCNDDAKSHIHREKFIKGHGGEFVKSGRFWTWQNIHSNEELHDETEKEITKYELQDKEGNTYIVDNLAKFCRQNELNKSAIYKVINGERSHHKGFICKKV